MITPGKKHSSNICLPLPGLGALPDTGVELKDFIGIGSVIISSYIFNLKKMVELSAATCHQNLVVNVDPRETGERSWKLPSIDPGR